MTESTIDIAADQFEILLERIKTDSTAALHRDFYAPALSLAIPVPERNRLTAAWTARSEAANAVNHLIIEGTFTLPFVTTTLREVTTLSIPLTSLRALTAQACGWNASPDIELAPPTRELKLLRIQAVIATSDSTPLELLRLYHRCNTLLIIDLDHEALPTEHEDNFPKTRVDRVILAHWHSGEPTLGARWPTNIFGVREVVLTNLDEEYPSLIPTSTSTQRTRSPR